MNIAKPNGSVARTGATGHLAVRIVAGLTLVLVLIGIQYVIADDIPMPFAPALMVVILAAWYGGFAAGCTTGLAAALAVNFLLLHPKRTWSTGKDEMLATLTFATISILAVLMVAFVRTSLRRLEGKLDSSTLAVKLESEQRRHAESEYVARLNTVESELKSTRGYADSYQRARRYADAITRRVVELQLAIEEFPVPMALVVEEDGIPVFRTASAAFFEFMGVQPRNAPAVLQAFDCIVNKDALPYGEAEHPLLRALDGEPIDGETVGWLCADRIRQARLFAKPVARQRMLGLALIPLPEAPTREFN